MEPSVQPRKPWSVRVGIESIRAEFELLGHNNAGNRSTDTTILSVGINDYDLPVYRQLRRKRRAFPPSYFYDLRKGGSSI